MSLAFFLLAASVFLCVASLVYLWLKPSASTESITPPMNKPSNPSEPKPQLGDTRIRVRTYGDGSVEYTPQVYEWYNTGYVSTEYADWHPIYPGGYITTPLVVQNYRFQHDAQTAIDLYLKAKRATTVVNTEYIKYP